MMKAFAILSLLAVEAEERIALDGDCTANEECESDRCENSKCVAECRCLPEKEYSLENKKCNDIRCRKELEWKCEDCTNGQLWRSDGKCGRRNQLPSGEPAQCNPDNEYGNTCCSSAGYCGKKHRDCYCYSCVDYKCRENRPSVKFLHSNWGNELLDSSKVNGKEKCKEKCEKYNELNSPACKYWTFDTISEGNNCDLFKRGTRWDWQFWYKLESGEICAPNCEKTDGTLNIDVPCTCGSSAECDKAKPLCDLSGNGKCTAAPTNECDEEFSLAAGDTCLCGSTNVVGSAVCKSGDTKCDKASKTCSRGCEAFACKKVGEQCCFKKNLSGYVCLKVTDETKSDFANCLPEGHGHGSF